MRKIFFGIFSSLLSLAAIGSAHAEAYRFFPRDSMNSQRWGLNDLSILLPISDPAIFDESIAISPATMGAAGFMVPANDLSLLSFGGAIGDALRAVAIRIDPCFPSLDFADLKNCQAQIRIVWQPVFAADSSSASTYVTDTAVHSFYNISQNEFMQLVEMIRSLKANYLFNSDQMPLQIHPIIGEEGLRGRYWTALRQMILQVTGAARLSRVTVMTNVSAFWAFAGVDVVNQVNYSLSIPRINATAQDLNNSDVSNAFTSVTIGPSPSGEDAYLSLLHDSNGFKSQSPQVQQQALNSVLMIENPKFANANTVDCASCHLAQSSRLWIQANLAGLNFAANPLLFRSNDDIANAFAIQSNSQGLRGFGYYESTPAISQRVINESSLIVDFLNNSR